MKAGTPCALSTDIIEPSTAFSSICAAAETSPLESTLIDCFGNWYRTGN